jgi:hypothetical protein
MTNNINYAQAMQTNPLLRVQASDENMIKTLISNRDPKLAEKLMEDKLKSIGLNDQEIAITFIRDGLQYPLERAMRETGLSQQQLDSYYDGAVDKINKFLGGVSGNSGVLSNLKSMFGSNANDGDLHKD